MITGLIYEYLLCGQMSIRVGCVNFKIVSTEVKEPFYSKLNLLTIMPAKIQFGQAAVVTEITNPALRDVKLPLDPSGPLNKYQENLPGVIRHLT